MRDVLILVVGLVFGLGFGYRAGSSHGVEDATPALDRRASAMPEAMHPLPPPSAVPSNYDATNVATLNEVVHILMAENGSLRELVRMHYERCEECERRLCTEAVR